MCFKKIFDYLVGLFGGEDEPPEDRPDVMYMGAYVGGTDKVRLLEIVDYNDVGRPVFLPAVKDNGKPIFILSGSIMTIYLWDDSRLDLVFQDDGSIIGDEGTTCYLIASGAQSSGLSASGYCIKVSDIDYSKTIRIKG